MNASTKVGRGVPLARCAAARVDRGGRDEEPDEDSPTLAGFHGSRHRRPTQLPRERLLARTGQTTANRWRASDATGFYGGRNRLRPPTAALEKGNGNTCRGSLVRTTQAFFSCALPPHMQNYREVWAFGFVNLFHPFRTRVVVLFWQAFTGRDIGVWPNCLASERGQAFTRAKSTSFPTAALLPGREVAKHRPWLSSPKTRLFRVRTPLIYSICRTTAGSELIWGQRRRRKARCPA